MFYFCVFSHLGNRNLFPLQPGSCHRCSESSIDPGRDRGRTGRTNWNTELCCVFLTQKVFLLFFFYLSYHTITNRLAFWHLYFIFSIACYLPRILNSRYGHSGTLHICRRGAFADDAEGVEANHSGGAVRRNGHHCNWKWHIIYRSFIYRSAWHTTV